MFTMLLLVVGQTKLLSDPGPSEALKAKIFGALEDRRQQVLQLEAKVTHSTPTARQCISKVHWLLLQNEMLLAIIEAEKQNSSGQQAATRL